MLQFAFTFLRNGTTNNRRPRKNLMTMHNFTRALSEYFDGPPVRPQNEFADRARIHRSKVCRLLKGTITCDRNTLDLILNAVPDAAARRKLVMAYINDYCSPGALLHLKADKHGQWEGFDFHPLSPKGMAALKALLAGPNVKGFEKVLVGLQEALA